MIVWYNIPNCIRLTHLLKVQKKTLTKKHNVNKNNESGTFHFSYLGFSIRNVGNVRRIFIKQKIKIVWNIVEQKSTNNSPSQGDVTNRRLYNMYLVIRLADRKITSYKKGCNTCSVFASSCR